jgi:hypothetical protein
MTHGLAVAVQDCSLNGSASFSPLAMICKVCTKKCLRAIKPNVHEMEKVKVDDYQSIHDELDNHVHCLQMMATVHAELE